MRREFDIKYTADDALHFVPQVITLLNKRGFLVESIAEALDCIDSLCLFSNAHEAQKAMHELYTTEVKERKNDN